MPVVTMGGKQRVSPSDQEVAVGRMPALSFPDQLTHFELAGRAQLRGLGITQYELCARRPSLLTSRPRGRSLLRERTMVFGLL